MKETDGLLERRCNASAKFKIRLLQGYKFELEEPFTSQHTLNGFLNHRAVATAAMPANRHRLDDVDSQLILNIRWKG